MAQNVSVI